MILISHRGNINGKNELLENSKEYIDTAIEFKYDVEIDVWSIDKQLYLGHDGPQYKVTKKWLIERKKNLWIHTKNFNALSDLIETELKLFFHEKESHTTIHNSKFIWSHNIFEANHKSVIPLLDEISLDKYINTNKNKVVYGICSDYVERLK